MEKNTLFVSSLILLVGISLSLLVKSEKHNLNEGAVVNEEIEQLSLEEEPQPPVEENQEEAASSYQSALDKAKAENKELVLFFTAEWCTNCTTMKEKTISTPKVQEALSKVVYLELDVDHEKELISKYKISSIPAYVRINSNEEELNRGVGVIKENAFLNWFYKK